jgi:4'-phosphopantetheinyl transferase
MSPPNLDWQTSLFPYVLPDHEVHVWRADLNCPPARVHHLQQVLSSDEQERARRFHFERDRRRYIVARGVLRTLLGRYLNLAPTEVEFVYNAWGKPSLIPQHGQATLHFNLSHSGELALYAFARQAEVGIDLELIRPDLDYEQIAEHFFSPHERTALRSLPTAVKGECFFQCWTRKEAYIKAKGQGLSIPLAQFTVSLRPGEPASLLAVQGDPHEARRWSFYELVPGSGYLAALVVERGGWQLQCYAWSQEQPQEW